MVGLLSFTTYYMRVGALNLNDAVNFAALGATRTVSSVDTFPPAPVAGLSAATHTATSMLLTWSAPSDPSDNPLSGNYAILYATHTGVTLSTAGAQVVFSTAGVTPGSYQSRVVSGLDANTTYYFHLWTSDIKPNWSTVSNASTAAVLSNPAADAAYAAIHQTSATVSWTPLPASPPAASAHGYRLEASSTNFGAAAPGGAVYSAAAAAVGTAELTLTGLDANTTYYYQVGSLNVAGAPNFAVLAATSTLTGQVVRLTPDFLGIFTASFTVNWAALPPAPAPQTAEGYRLAASSTAFDGTGVVLTSSTPNVALSTLTVYGLTPNVTYYFRAGGLNWNGAANYAVLPASVTLANPPLAAALPFILVGASSVTAQWTGNGNAPGTLYVVDFSTALNFSGTVLSSATRNTSAARQSLTPNSTYYARVRAANHGGIASVYTALGSTLTLANAPVPATPVFAPVFISSLTLSYDPGTPANPVGTRYDVELSSFSDFSAVYSSDTAEVSAFYAGLAPNTTYFARARGRNADGKLTSYGDMGSTATLAAQPGAPAEAFTAVGAGRFTLNWTSGTAPVGFNSTYTLFNAQISEAQDFSAALTEVSINGLSAQFGGLVPGTTYYARVRARNHQNIPTNFTTLGSTVTGDSSKPGFVSGTFEVSDSQGQYIDSSLYTDTDTPNVRIQVQSKFTPGLAVDEADSPLVRWSLDEGSGAAADDHSRNDHALNLQNSPSWISGRLGSALDFNGASNYAVSVDLAPWRSSAAHNEWTVSFWFRASVNSGYLFQTANKTDTSSGNFDADIAWHNTSGKLSAALRGAGGAQKIAEGDAAYTDGGWHFVMMVLGSSGLYLYVDGNQAGSNTGVTSNDARTYSTTIHAWVGAASKLDSNLGNGSLFANADIDEVYIDTVAFSAQEAADAYAMAGTGHRLEGPALDISIADGDVFTWTRLPGNAFTISGADGTTGVETWTATDLPVAQTAAPGAGTNQVFFIASALDGKLTTAQFTVLVDTTAPTNAVLDALTAVTTYGMTVSAQTAADALSGLAAAPYQIQAAADSGFGAITEDSGYIAAAAHVFTGLAANTTYYFRTRAKDAAGNAAGFSSSLSTSTLAKAPVALAESFLNVFQTSVTANWAARPASPQALSAEGYRLDASTAADFSGTLRTIATGDVAESTLTVAGLAADTTYYFRAGSLNWNGQAKYLSLGSTATLGAQITALDPTYLEVFPDSVTVNWAALPGGGGYILEASALADFSAGILSSTTFNAALSTLTVSGLDPNTTYYFRAGALNQGGAANFRVFPATSSLADAPTALTYDGLFASSATLSWTAPAGGAQGYVLQASASQGFGGTVLSSATPNGGLTALTLTGLDENTTYYFRAGSLNHNGAVRFGLAAATSTLAGAALSPAVVAVHLTSATLSWTAPAFGAAGDRVDASATADFSGGVISSETANGDLTTLTVETLSVNTTYYFRVGGRNWNSVLNFAADGSTSTLTNPPAGPGFGVVGVSSVSVTWSAPAGGAEGFRVDASTAASFTGNVTSSKTYNGAATSLTVVSLLSDTTYYLRVAALNWSDAPSFSAVGSTLTGTSADGTAPGPVANLSASTVSATSMLLTWTAPTDATDNPLSGNYAILYATHTNVTLATASAQVVFSTSNVAPGAYQSRLVGGLFPDSTYYFHLWTADIRPNWSSISNGTTVATLASPIENTQIAATFASSATLNWKAFAMSPASMTSVGYLLQASLDPAFGGTVHSTRTFSAALSTLTVSGLDANSTYYFRAGAVNPGDAPNFVAGGSSSTLTRAVNTLTPAFLGVFAGSVTANWAALPTTPASQTAEGYRLEASTAANFSGTVLSSATTGVAVSTLTVSGLGADTTYYFRAGGINWNGKPHFTALGSTASLAGVPTGVTFSGVFLSSMSVTWGVPAGGAQGYRVQASPAADFSGAVLTSATANGAATGLVVSGLLANTTYYVRAGSLNRNHAVNNAVTKATSTLAVAPTALAEHFLAVYAGSVTANWAARPAAPPESTAQGYVLEAAINANFSGTVLSSATANVLSSTLTVSGIGANTTYYFRVGSLNHNGAANYTVLAATRTFSSAPGAADPTFTGVFVTSAALQWTSGGNPAGTKYKVELSSVSDFGSAIRSSATYNLSALVLSLVPNATYYARVQSVNVQEIGSDFTAIGSTITLANTPAAASPVFAPVFVSSLTVGITAGSPANTAGTRYQVELSSFSSFSAVFSSNTANLSAYFSGLHPNTTYYARARARNGSWLASSYAGLGSTATLAVAPGAAAASYAAVGADRFTLSWTSGTGASGYNPADTAYEAQISDAVDFSGTLIERTVNDISYQFIGLVPGTTYYARVRARSRYNFPSAFTTYGSTLTLDSAKPGFISGTFEVSDALGAWQDAAVYTDTDTPNIRIQVQSKFAPGLSVTGTPSHLGLWHFDEGSGTDANDSGPNGHTAALQGTPKPGWITGRIGKALDFDGSQNRAVSIDLEPWRSTAGHNEWSVSMWFRTSTAQGYMFQAADSASAGAANYDAEIGWRDTSGNLAFVVTNNAGARRLVQAGGTYADGAWHFVTAVLSTTGMYLYVDGGLAASGSQVVAATARTYPSAIYAWLGAGSVQGASMGNGSRFANVDIDEVRIATTALSGDQAAETYNLAAGGHSLAAPAVAVSTEAGTDFTWLGLSTNTFSISGADGTTAVQTWTANKVPLKESLYPGAGTNSVYLVASALDSKFTTAQFTILVDTDAPTMADNQPNGDWISADPGAVFDVDFHDQASGITSAEYRIRSGAGDTGTILKVWTPFFTSTGTAHVLDEWAVDYSALQGGLNYISARAFDQVGRSTVTTDVFIIRKDDTAPTFTNNESGGDLVWRSAARSYDYAVEFHDTGGSLLQTAQYAAYTGAGQTGANPIAWTDIATDIGAADRTASWPIAFNLLEPGTNYISVRVWDYAASTATLNDAFKVWKDTVTPAPVGDLAVTQGHPVRGTLMLNWTAPGDNGTGDANTEGGYIVKVTSDGAITNQTLFDAATTYVQALVPKAAGQTESIVFAELLIETTYYFAVRAFDKAHSTAGISNSPWEVPQIKSVYINEVLAGGSGAGSDWVEIFNQTPDAHSLDGWTLSYNQGTIDTPGSEAAVWTGSGDDTISSGGFLTMIPSVDMDGGSSYHVVLRDAAGLLVGKVQWPAQAAGQSFARIADGDPDYFEVDPTPTQNIANAVTGDVKINEVNYQALADEFIEFFNIGGAADVLTDHYLRSGNAEAFRFTRTVPSGAFNAIDVTSVDNTAQTYSAAFGGSGLTAAGDYVVLENAAGQVLDRVTWESGAAYSYRSNKAVLISYSSATAGGLADPKTIGRVTNGLDTGIDAADFTEQAAGSFGATNVAGTPPAANTLSYPTSSIYFPRRFRLGLTLGADSTGGVTDSAWLIRTGGAADSKSPHLYDLAALNADLSSTGAQDVLIGGTTTYDYDGNSLVDGAVYKLVLRTDTGAGLAAALERTALTFDASLSTVSVSDATIDRVNNGARTALFKFTVNSNSPGAANGLELAQVTVQLTDKDLYPLGTASAQAIFSSIHIIADAVDNDTTGQFHAGIDTEVVVSLPSASFALDANGVQVITVGDPNDDEAKIAAGDYRRYFLAVDWAADAAAQVPNNVRATVDAETGIGIRDGLSDTMQILEDATPVTTSSSTAIAPAQPPAGTTYPRDLGGTEPGIEAGIAVSWDTDAPFVGTKDGRMISLNIDGTVKWTFTTSPAGAIKTVPFFDQVTGTDYIYFANDQGDIYKIHDGGGGSAVQDWKRDLSGTFKSAIVPTFDGGGAVDALYIGGQDGKVYKLDPATGDTDAGWSFDPSISGAFSGTAYLDNRNGVKALWIGSEGGGIYRLKTVDGTVTTSESPSAAAIRITPNLDSGGSGDSNNIFWGADDGVFRARTSANLSTIPGGWSDYTVSPSGALRSSPYISRDESPRAIYFGCDNGKLYKLNAGTGALIWARQTGAQVRGTPVMLPTSITSAGANYIYVGSDDGYVYGLKVADGAHRDGWPVYVGSPVRGELVYDYTNNAIVFGTLEGKVYVLEVGP
ncbi:MAG: fibronectin type III domain-containing protein [Elusimicrobiota bacterium]